ncbi:helix-turn-helix domain-containing protein [Mesorhizobium sp. CAU 1732]|uniref:helix-turn-helix domain-containing protein n=1 Tax=Mesorhizobium sp. CAU 1732 TaxID=3140358 RepID=UPI003261128A
MITSDKPFVFSSEATRDDTAAGFGRYHDLYPVASDVAMTGERFHAEARAHQLSRMIVLDRRISGVTHSRSARHAKRDGFDHVVLQLLVSGRWINGAPSEERLVQPGEVIFHDMTRPHRNCADGARIVTINLPRDQIERAMPMRPGAHGAILPASASQLLGEFMLLLVRRGGAVPAQMADSAGRAVAELVAGAFASLDGQHAPANREAHFTALRRERAELFIEARLADQALDADLVAYGLGVSRTVLYQMFKTSGGVARYILARRLERLGNALRQRSETRSVSQLAFMCGFSSESHCSRAFRAAYGMPPGQYRNEATREKRVLSTPVGPAHSELDTWHAALR